MAKGIEHFWKGLTRAPSMDRPELELPSGQKIPQVVGFEKHGALLQVDYQEAMKHNLPTPDEESMLASAWRALVGKRR